MRTFGLFSVNPFSVHLCLFSFLFRDRWKLFCKSALATVHDSNLIIRSVFSCKNGGEIISGGDSAITNLYIWFRSFFLHFIVVGLVFFWRVSPCTSFSCSSATLGDCRCIIQGKCHHDKSNLSGEPLVAAYLCTCINNQIYQKGSFQLH